MAANRLLRAVERLPDQQKDVVILKIWGDSLSMKLHELSMNL